jgi:hypothetical protein
MKKIIFYVIFIALTWIIAGCPSPGTVRKKMPRLFADLTRTRATRNDPSQSNKDDIENNFFHLNLNLEGLIALSRIT